MEEYANHGNSASKEQSKESKSLTGTSDPLKKATKELRTFFGNGKSIDTIIDAGNALAEDGSQDEFRECFRKVDVYIRKV
jgi:hypothetical protein